MAKRIHGKVNLEDWSLPSIDDLVDGLSDKLKSATMHGVADALEVAFETVAIDFAVLDDDVADPLDIDLNFEGIASNAGESEDGRSIENDDSLTIRLSLDDAVTARLDDCASDGSYASGFIRLSKSLRALADRIDSIALKHSE